MRADHLRTAFGLPTAAVALLLLALFPPAATAQPSSLSGFSLLRLDTSARSAAMGGAFSAVFDDDVNAFFYNPALLNGTAHNVLSVSYLNHLSDINAGFLAYGRDMVPLGTVGVGIRFISFGQLDGFDEDGVEQGSFAAGDVVASVAVARPLGERLQVGAGLHLGYSSIETTSATALMADLGVLYRFPDQLLTLSASVNNLGFALDRYYSDRVPLPTDVRLGVTKELQHLPLLLSVGGYDLHEIRQDSEGASTLGQVMRHLALGSELRLAEPLAIRIGYSHRRQEQLQQQSRFDGAGLSAGFGVNVSELHFDYAYSSWSTTLGALHQFTLRLGL